MQSRASLLTRSLLPARSCLRCCCPAFAEAQLPPERSPPRSRSSRWIHPVEPSCFQLQGAVRHFAKKRRRLDEYDSYEKPLSAKAWKKLRMQGDFFEFSFQDMSPSEVSETVWIASKMELESEAFWRRAALAMGDLAGAMTPRQLTTACYAFGTVAWRDEAMVHAVATPLARHAGDMKPADLAGMAQALSRMKVRNVRALRALSQAVQASSRINGKGLAMVASAFAELAFCCEGFLEGLDIWAAEGGVNTCKLEQLVSLFHSISLLATTSGPSPWPSPVVLGQSAAPLQAAVAPIAARKLAESLAPLVKSLEPPTLHTVVLAQGKLRLQEPELLAALEHEVGQELHRLHVNSLPPVLESFAVCYEANPCSQQGLEQRQAFLAKLTGRMARELRLLRPQDATRVLQSLDRLGLVDARLLGKAAELVPQRLAAWPAKELLALLEAYAAAANQDGFMVPSLRRALVPLPQAMQQPLRLAQLDDMQVVRAAESFAALGHTPGIVAILVALGIPRGSAELPEGRQLTPSCQLALAALVETQLPCWSSASKPLVHAAAKVAEGDDSAIVVAAVSAAEEWWPPAAAASRYSGDDLLLAAMAFPQHPAQATWQKELELRVAECSLALLPGFILQGTRDGSQAPHGVIVASEAALLQRLSDRKELQHLPAAVVVAAFRAFACLQTWRGSAETPDVQAQKTALLALVHRLASLAEEDQLPAKAAVRILQSIKVLRLQPPAALVESLSKTAGTLSPEEFLAALRPLTARSVKASGGGDALAAAATRAMAQLKSSRQAWELESLCRNLCLDVGEVNPDEDTHLEEPQEVRQTMA